MSNIENIQIKPMLVYVGVDRAQVQKITARGSTLANSLVGKYFLLNLTDGAKHAVWFGLTGTVAPTIAGGWTLHKVVITEGDSQDTVAAAMQAILDAITGMDASVSGAVVTLTFTANGFANPAYDSGGATATSFNFYVSVLGSTEVAAGCIDGDISITGLDVDEADIVCHESGTTVLGKLVKGYKPISAKIHFKETDVTNLKRAFVLAGQYPLTPVGASATDVLGFGVTNVGKQIPTSQIRLHPVAKADGDRSEDVTFWKTRGVFDELTFSGENIQTIPLTFTVFADQTKLKPIQFFMIGDSTQAGLTL